jgi:hypothetical protein
MPDEDHDHSDEVLQAPPALVSAFKRLPNPPIFIPPTADEAILRAASRRFNRRQQSRWFRFIPWVAAAAAAILLLAIIRPFLPKPASAPSAGSRFAQEDLNHDGQVDILDAFALARRLKAGATANPQLDLNGDGVIDERDITIIAARAVKLEKDRHL